jgi:pantothenate kinase type III
MSNRSIEEKVLLVDIGNTTTKFAQWSETRGVKRLTFWKTGQGCIVSDGLLNQPWDGAVVSSVGYRTSVKQLLDALSERGIPYVTISSELVEKFGIVSGLYPGQGADRVANVVAMSQLHPLPSLCVDMGTAITFDLVGETKTYVGGLITPGPTLMTQALAEGTARLPRVEESAGAHLLEADTRAAISSGCWWGGVGMVNGLLGLLRKNGMEWQALALTGGLCEEYTANVAFQHVVDVDITFKGMAFVWQAGNARTHTG